MRGLRILIVAVVPILSGCNLFKIGSFVAVNETHLYADQQALQKRAFISAQEAWLDHLSHLKESCPPPAYEHGFIDGFADYLLYGGNGSAPAIPPPEYRRRQALSPDGHREIQDYYAGFVAGASNAKASGLRDYYVIPVSSPLAPAPGRYQEKATVEKEPTSETLPAPRPLDDKDKPLDDKKKATDDKKMSRNGNSLPPAIVVSSPRSSAALKPEFINPRPAPVENAPAPQRIQPMPTEGTPSPDREPQPLPIGPANAAQDAAAPALPREFSLPILGGPSFR